MWSGETFVESERHIRVRLPIYGFKDYVNEEIEENFYQTELQNLDVC